MRDAAWEERERCLYDIALEQREFTEKKIKELFFEKFGSYLVAPGKSVFMRIEELAVEGVFSRTGGAYRLTLPETEEGASR